MKRGGFTRGSGLSSGPVVGCAHVWLGSGACDVLCTCRTRAVQGTRKVFCGLFVSVNCSEILCGR